MKLKLSAFALAAVLANPLAAQSCDNPQTLKDGVLTIATGNPAYFPWVLNDDPESGEGYEAAVAYEIAKRMGFEKDAVSWVRTSFDQAIQPGAKAFDFNLQQFTILPAREEVIDFSDPYYNSALAIVVRPDVAERLGDDNSIEAVRSLKFGGASGQVSSIFVSDFIKPTQDQLLYDDLSDVQAALVANQVEATLFEVPTALFVTAVQYPEGKILGTIEHPDGMEADQFGLVFAEGSPLVACANEAIGSMHEDGTLDELVATWINSAAGLPVIQMDN